MALVKAQMISDYEATCNSHLDVIEHEIVTLKELHSEGWYLVENRNGMVGWVPASCIKSSTPLRAIADFQPQLNEDEVSLSEGIIVFGFKREGDWWYGESLSAIGWFPCTYCEPALEVVVPMSRAANPGRTSPAPGGGGGNKTPRATAPPMTPTGQGSNGGGSNKAATPSSAASKSYIHSANLLASPREGASALLQSAAPSSPEKGKGGQAQAQGSPASTSMNSKDIVVDLSNASLDQKKPSKVGSTAVVSGAGGAEGKPKAPAAAVIPGQQKRGGKCDTLVLAAWAHNMGQACAFTMLVLGVFPILWTDIKAYGCMLEGGATTIFANYTKPHKACYDFCCDPKRTPADVANALSSRPSMIVGIYSLALVPVLLVFENIYWGMGLRFPAGSWYVRTKFPLHGLVYLILSIYPCFAYPTVLGGAFMMITAIVYMLAAYYQEFEDGGRAAKAKAKDKEKEKAKDMKNPSSTKDTSSASKDGGEATSAAQSQNACLNPWEWYKKARDEDLLAVYTWVFIYFVANILIFVTTLGLWTAARNAQIDGLKSGSLIVNPTCTSKICKVNRALVKYGPISAYGPWAKACGNCLNFNCALILIPIARLLLRYVNNVGTSFSRAQKNASLFARLFAHPMTRYIPLSKNIAFHKLIAKIILLFTVGHVLFHFFNYWKSPEITLARFAKFGWGGTAYLTGSIICLAMFFIYTAAPNQIRFAKYEIFFTAHHWFIVFFIFLLAHGPVFYAWAIIPLLLYATERYLRVFRGNRSYIVNKVEWVPPVMAVQFRPEIKDQFRFKEGQYLYLNCPFIDENEWHPFTISSAQDDLYSGPRICLETGEEVNEVPRPKDVSATDKWSKYCPISKDWRTLQRHELLDKHETGYNDYVSVHIKVHGLDDPEAVTWTRKLKEYFELMNPANPFPYYFRRRDERGDLQIGRRNGPDGKPILRVDGPHSAPSEHYTNYATCMIIGAGIGVTPCSSILTAMLKYRWRKNFNPELLHFYWVVRQDEVDAFQWFIHHLADLQYRLKSYRASGAVEKRYYCEINIYITSVGKDPVPEKPMRAASKTYSNPLVCPSFTSKDLYNKMLNPTVKSSTQIEAMKDVESVARLQDIWIWNGRPYWDKIFEERKKQRQHSDIGVCFCGTPIIGKDLKAMCMKYSSADEDCVFTLHKENF